MLMCYILIARIDEYSDFAENRKRLIQGIW